MQKIFYIFLLSIGSSLFVHATTIKNEKIIKTTENIKYLSQKIANDYLYLYQNPKKKSLKRQLSSNIKNLEENFRFIAKNTKNEDTKNILDFLSYSKDQLKTLLNQDTSSENALSVLDHSEALFEGTESILMTYPKNISTTDFVHTHLMRISKLYMAMHLNINHDANKQQIQNEIKLIDEKFNATGTYIHLRQSWYTLKNILMYKEDYFIPNIVFILVQNLENLGNNHE